MGRYFNSHDRPATLAAALSNMNADELKTLAAVTRTRAPNRKAELVEHILEHLRGDRLQAAWQCLDQSQKAAVAEAVHSDDATFNPQAFRAKYGTSPNLGTMDGCSRDCYATGLRFFIFFGNGTSGEGIVPVDLRDRLKAFVPPPSDTDVKVQEELPASYDLPFRRWNSKTRECQEGTQKVALTVKESERTAQRELLAVLRLVDAGRLTVGTTGKASAASIKEITALLDGGDFYRYEPPGDGWPDQNAGPIRAFAWPLLLQAGGLARASGSKLQLTKAGRAALAEPAPATLKTLWQHWCDADIIDELSRVDAIKGQTGKGKRCLTPVAPRRHALSRTLRRCPQGRWVSVAEVERILIASGQTNFVTRGCWGLYVADPQYGSFGHSGWSAYIDGRYLLCLLLEYAATLGILDVAYLPPVGARRDYRELWGTDSLPFFSRYDGLMFVRLNALGAFCLGAADTYAPAPMEVKPVLRVLPNLDIAAVGAELEHGDRLALDCYATRTSDLVWKLEATKLLGAVEDGRTIVEVREFLTARSGSPLPDTVSRLLEDVSERSTRIHDRGLARLVECVDGALAALIANDTRTRRHCMRAGERHLVVPTSSETAFRRGLRELGYLVAHGRACSPSATEPTEVPGASAQAAEA